MKCDLLNKPKVRCYRKRMLRFWLNKDQRLVDQVNSTCRNSWITELEIKELERNLAENDSNKEEDRK